MSNDNGSPSRPGWKTTEFWITVTAIAAVVVLMLAGRLTIEDVLQLWPIFFGGGAYAVSRGLAKKANGG